MVFGREISYPSLFFHGIASVLENDYNQFFELYLGIVSSTRTDPVYKESNASTFVKVSFYLRYVAWHKKKNIKQKN